MLVSESEYWEDFLKALAKALEKTPRKESRNLIKAIDKFNGLALTEDELDLLLVIEGSLKT